MRALESYRTSGDFESYVTELEGFVNSAGGVQVEKGEMHMAEAYKATKKVQIFSFGRNFWKFPTSLSLGLAPSKRSQTNWNPQGERGLLNTKNLSNELARSKPCCHRVAPATLEKGGIPSWVFEEKKFIKFSGSGEWRGQFFREQPFDGGGALATAG